jgi:hypothetical protein
MAMTTTPTLIQVKGGWAALGTGWAVTGETQEQATIRDVHRDRGRTLGVYHRYDELQGQWRPGRGRSSRSARHIQVCTCRQSADKRQGRANSN